MLAKPAEKLLRCFYIVFIAAFTWLFINMVFLIPILRIKRLG